VSKLKLIVTGAVAAAMLALPGAALAKSRDRDHDKMPDRWERAHHLSTHKKNAKGDPDRDGLNNLGEFRAHSNPHDADTDNDGLDDGDEHATANDPTDRDTDNDGVEDGDEQSGTIAGFDQATGVLTITVPGRGDVSGVVNDATEIKCETEGEQEDANDDRGDDSRVVASRDGSGSGDGDNSGPGSNSSGPGDGDRGDEGDDEGNCTTADLTPGTPVHEAELDTSSDPATFREVELLK